LDECAGRSLKPLVSKVPRTSCGVDAELDLDVVVDLGIDPAVKDEL